MAGRFSWARGPLDWDTREHRSLGSSAIAETVRRSLAEKGWQVDVGAASDLVARDPGTDHEIRIQVKALPTSRASTRVLVSDPTAPVDAHVFVTSDDNFVVVPTTTLRMKGRAGVLQMQDVGDAQQGLDALKKLA